MDEISRLRSDRPVPLDALSEEKWYGAPIRQIGLHETTDQIEIFTAFQNGGHTYSQGAENRTGTIAYLIPGRSAADYALMNDGVSSYTK